MHGGGNRLDAICSAMAVHDPDVIVLSEVHTDSVQQIKSSFCMQPWQHCAFPRSDRANNIVCVLSRVPLIVRDGCPVPDGNAERWIDIDLPGCGFGMGAVHIPGSRSRLYRNGSSKRSFWAALVRAASDRQAEPFLFVGDLNTGRRGIDEPGHTFVCSEEFEKMTELGWTDTWRHCHGSKFEASWVSNRGTGRRLDHAFVSPALLARLLFCRYSHTERENKLSDHSLLVLDIAELNLNTPLR